jgi:hypothetical protein
MGDGISHSYTNSGSQNPALRALIRLIAEIVADDLAAEQRAKGLAFPATETLNGQTPPFDNSS